jgi:peptidoglycan/LPS O-acetylase OafA/YrhL
MSLAYRTEIDGLRAIAVVPVIFFHAQLAGVTGGYIGVDVFFVISGFLITSLLLKEIDAQNFSYANFWERRARRLLPALIVVTLATFCVGAFVLLPDQFKSLGQSIVASSVFASNIYFWMEAGYFAAPSEMVPLLHTWSLAVEEQFYLLFPAILIAVGVQRELNRRIVIAAIGILSLAVSIWWVETDIDSAYYLLPSRAWELMIGSYLALAPRKRILSTATADMLLTLGLLLILVPMFAYTADTPFPGLAAVPSCLGTALVIWVGRAPGSFVQYIFTNSASVYVGKMSYSLYLWHWPALVLGAAYLSKSISDLSGLEVSVLIVISIAGAWMSLTLVENPIRYRSVLASRSKIFLAVSISLAGLGTFGLTAHLSGGMKWRVPEHVQTLAEAKIQSVCKDVSVSLQDLESGAICRIGAAENGVNPTFVLWGDSHASSLTLPVHVAANERNIAGYVTTRGGCPPLLGFESLAGRYSSNCAELNDAIVSFIVDNRIETAVLAGHWSTYGYEHKNWLTNIEQRTGNDTSFSNFKTAMNNTLSQLERLGIKIIIVNEVPHPDTPFHPSRYATALWHGHSRKAGTLLADYQSRESWFLTEIQALNEKPIMRLDLTPYLCSAGYCPAVVHGQAVYRDNHHLSVFGAEKLLPVFSSVFAEVDSDGSPESD